MLFHEKYIRSLIFFLFNVTLYSTYKYRTHHRQGRTFHYVSMPKYSLPYNQTSPNGKIKFKYLNWISCWPPFIFSNPITQILLNPWTMTDLDSQYPQNMIKQLISNAKQWASKFWDVEESATTTLDRRKQTILSNDSNLERDTPGQVVSKISTAYYKCWVIKSVIKTTFRICLIFQ